MEPPGSKIIDLFAALQSAMKPGKHPMDHRRHETQAAATTTMTTTAVEPPKQATSAPDSPEKTTKPLTPMQEAVKLQAALDKVNKREADYINNAKARYQAERDALLGLASGKAKRILEEAGKE